MAWLNLSFESTALHMPVMLDVLIPQGRGNYKCLYLLHGAGGDHSSWLTKSRISDYVEMTNIAVIMPSGNNKCYVDNRYGKDYFQFITVELIEKCEQWFSLSKDPKDRFIGGMSMGGYGSIYAALMKPNLYSKVFSYSGLLNILERYDHPQGLALQPIFGTREALITGTYDLHDLSHKTSGLIGANVENCPEFHIFCGEQDPRLKMSTDFYETLKQDGFSCTCHAAPGAHNWEYWDRCIEQTISFIDDVQNK